MRSRCEYSMCGACGEDVHLSYEGQVEHFVVCSQRKNMEAQCPDKLEPAAGLNSMTYTSCRFCHYLVRLPHDCPARDEAEILANSLHELEGQEYQEATKPEAPQCCEVHAQEPSCTVCGMYYTDKGIHAKAHLNREAGYGIPRDMAKERELIEREKRVRSQEIRNEQERERLAGWEASLADEQLEDMGPPTATWGDIEAEPKYGFGYTFEETFEAIFREAFDLLVERQKKYGPENIRQLGLWGTFGRLADDKVERVRRSFSGEIERGVLTIRFDGDYDDESLEDAILDIANYAFIMLALKRGVWGRPLIREMF